MRPSSSAALLRARIKFAATKLSHFLLIALTPLVLVGLTLFALVERVATMWRRVRLARPRVIWGPSAILNIKYWSEAIRVRGYQSITAVDTPAVITGREDWDVVRSDFLGAGASWEPFRSYAMFIWALRHGDVFVRFCDLGFLRFTPIQWFEYPITRLAGKRLIVTSYGGDIAVAGHLGRFEEVTFADYPELEDQAELFRRRVHHSIRWANLTVRNHGLGYLPSFDAVCLNQLTVDTDLWSDPGSGSGAAGGNGTVKVVHAPNHRRIKGTHHLERAIRELRADGLDVELQILERRSNEEVRAAVLASDIVADQFYGGYGLFALEGMAAGKPVIGNLTMEWLPPEVLAARDEQGSPIVDSNPERLREDLRRLIQSPDRRRELGKAGREFVMRHHSYEAVGKTWEDLIEHVWSGRSLPEPLVPRPS